MMRLWLIGGLLLGLLLLLGAASKAQVPAYTQYMIDDGLASSTVYAAIQDRDGFIWFATEAGVSRFDGTNFQNFTTVDGLSANDVLNLYEDSQGRIWFFPYCTNVCYYQAGKIHNAKTDPWLAQIAGLTFIPSFFEDSRGNMWFGDDGFDVWKLTPQGEVKAFCPENQLGSLTFWRFFESAQGEVMVSGCAGIVALEQPRIIHKCKPWLPLNFQRSTMLGPDSMLIGTRTTITLIHGNKDIVIPNADTLVESEIICMQADARDNLWIGTRNGVVCLTSCKLKPTGFEFKAKKKFLPSKEVTSVLVDREGNYWFTSLTQGVFFFPFVEAITYTNPTPGESSFVNRVFRDRQGKVWIGFDHGQYAQLVGDSFTTYTFPFPLTGRGRTNEIYEDLQGNVFLTNDQAGAVFAPDGRRKFFQGSSIKAIAQSGDLAYHGGASWELHEVSVKDPVNDFFENMSQSHLNRSLLLVGRVLDICHTRTGRLFVGTVSGLKECVGKTYEPVASAPKSSISAIQESRDGILWISTLSEGVGYFLGDNYFPITEKDGLASDICYGFAIDEGGIVYVATNHGISMVQVLSYPDRKFQILNFGTNVGLASEEVRNIAVGGGKVYAATAGGLTVLDATQLISVPLPVHLVISQLTIGAEHIPLTKQPLVFHKAVDRLSVSYVGIAFRNAPNLEYAYQLARDNEPSPWVKTKSQRLEFPALPAGKYRLSVAGYIQGWYATAGSAVIYFEIEPAFWETTSFQFVIVAVIILSMLGIFWLIVQRLKAQSRRRLAVQKRISELEQQALRSQMNPHFIFNSLNSIEHFFIQGRLEEGNQYIADFSALMRAVLDASSKQAIPVSDELRLIELFMSLESHRLNGGFDFSLHVAEDISAEETLMPPLLLQPIVENAIWHGVSSLEHQKGVIAVEVQRVEVGICITIDDNGIGREKSAALKAKYRQKHRSSGVRLIHERFDLLNGDLEPGKGYSLTFEDKTDADGQAAGTRVSFVIPLTDTSFPA